LGINSELNGHSWMALRRDIHQNPLKILEILGDAHHTSPRSRRRRLHGPQSRATTSLRESSRPEQCSVTAWGAAWVRIALCGPSQNVGAAVVFRIRTTRPWTVGRSGVAAPGSLPDRTVPRESQERRLGPVPGLRVSSPARIPLVKRYRMLQAEWWLSSSRECLCGFVSRVSVSAASCYLVQDA